MENIVGKGETAGYHFSNIKFVICKCFQFGHIQKFVIWWRVKLGSNPGPAPYQDHKKKSKKQQWYRNYIKSIKGLDYVFWIIHLTRFSVVWVTACLEDSKHIYPFPKGQILDSSKLKEFEDDNFEFDAKVRKFFKWIENAVGKGEIARNEQFLLCPQCFQKTCTADS